MQDLNTEKELLNSAKTDKREFDKLYKYYVNDVYRFVYSLVDNQHDAEDIAAQTFVEFYKKLDSFEWQGISLKFWLFRVAKNLTFKKFRNNKNLIQLDEDYMVPDNLEINFVDEIIAKDLIDSVKSEIEKLHPQERAIINLRIWEGMSFKEIADLNELSEDAARMRFNRSVQKLRDVFEKKENKKLLALPLLFTAIAKVGVQSTYAAPTSLINIGISTLLHTQTMSNTIGIQSIFASKVGAAVVTGLIAVAGTSTAFIAYNNANQTSSTKTTQVVVTATPTKIPQITPIVTATSLPTSTRLPIPSSATTLPTKISTPTPTPVTIFSTTRLSMIIPSGWTYQLVDTSDSLGNTYKNDGIILKRGKYRITILSHASQASGVTGGRFGDISQYVISNQITSFDPINCVAAFQDTTTLVKQSFTNSDLYLDPTGQIASDSTLRTSCGNPKTLNEKWYGSYYSTQGYFLNYYDITNKVDPLDGSSNVVIAFANDSAVDQLPTKSVVLNSDLYAMQNIVNSITWK